MSFALASLLKPLGALLFFFLAYLIGRALFRVIPDGNIKRILYDRSIQKEHPWKFAGLFFVLFYGVIFFAIWATGGL